MMYIRAHCVALLSTCFLLILSACGTEENTPIAPDTTTVSKDDLLSEINAVRTNPRQYASYLATLRQYYNGNRYEEPGATPLITQEGVAALNEAIAALNAATPLAPLAWSNGLEKAAADHVRDTGPRGITGHTGSDGSTVETRANRYGTWQSIVGENIAYGTSTARKIITQLLIDDGVPSRGHRDNIMNAAYRVVGMAYGSHSVYKSMCVMDFAGGYVEAGIHKPVVL